FADSRDRLHDATPGPVLRRGHQRLAQSLRGPGDQVLRRPGTEAIGSDRGAHRGSARPHPPDARLTRARSGAATRYLAARLSEVLRERPAGRLEPRGTEA